MIHNIKFEAVKIFAENLWSSKFCELPVPFWVGKGNHFVITCESQIILR